MIPSSEDLEFSLLWLPVVAAEVITVIVEAVDATVLLFGAASFALTVLIASLVAVVDLVLLILVAAPSHERMGGILYLSSGTLCIVLFTLVLGFNLWAPCFPRRLSIIHSEESSYC
ncbi:hypothetical protein F5B18DRAFT_134622 [Nemania serpens]|nr:hypothetical protein F5B18DRAFT_134622 [Nemania serpens]